VNGRRIVNRTITHALEFAYHELLQPKQFPLAVLSITVDPAQVDVNVHPAKAEVRFHREQEVHGVVVRAIKEALAGISMIRELATWRPSVPPTPGPRMEFPNLTPESNRYDPLTAAFTPVTATVSHAGLRAIGQLHGTYLLAEGRDGLLIFNQHRTHERIVFDRLIASGTHAESQRLILPATLHLAHREAALLEDSLDERASWGFDIAPLSGQPSLTRAAPAVLAGANPETAVREILADLDVRISIAPFSSEETTGCIIQEGRRRLLASLACKAAVKAGKILDIREQQQLLNQLEASSSSTMCPHGGLIIMAISSYELDKKFIR
jgi:DNA mismatch repair protein MutL